MAIPARTSRPRTYFITSVTHNRRRLFQVDRHAKLFLETLQRYRAEGHYKLHAFVVMPDHIHLLLTPQAITLERAVGLIKGGFSHRLSSPNQYGNEVSPTTASATEPNSKSAEPTSTKILFAPTSSQPPKSIHGLPPQSQTDSKTCQAPKPTKPAPIQRNRVAYEFHPHCYT